MATEHKSIAQELFNSYRRKETFRPLENSGTLEEAYAIQDEFQRLLIADGAGDIVGYKIALTSPAMQAFVGLDHPCGGAIFASRVLGSPQIVDLSDFQHLGVECEIAVRLKADLPMLPDGHSPETVAPFVGAVMPAFELVEDRDANYDEIDAFSLIAGNSWNAANILGTAVTNVQELNLPTLRGVLRVNGTVIDEGTGADALGNPLAAVAARTTVEVIERHGLVERARQNGDTLLRAAREILTACCPQLIDDVRGLGLLIGIEFKEEHLAAGFIFELMHRHVIVSHSLNSHRVVRITPSALLDESDIESLTQAIRESAIQLATTNKDYTA